MTVQMSGVEKQLTGDLSGFEARGTQHAGTEDADDREADDLYRFHPPTGMPCS